MSPVPLRAFVVALAVSLTGLSGCDTLKKLWARFSGSGREAAKPAGSAPAALKVVEKLELNRALWGVAVPNTVKGVDVAWDGRRGRLFTKGIATDEMLVTEPARANHPVRAVSLESGDWSPSSTFVDAERRRVIWVARTNGDVRVLDADSLDLVAKWDAPKSPAGPRRKFSHIRVQDVAFDAKTGWVWEAEPVEGLVRGWAPDLADRVELTDLTRPYSIAAAPDGSGLFVLDAPRPGTAVLLRYDPTHEQIVEVTKWEGEARPRRPPGGGGAQHRQGRAGGQGRGGAGGPPKMRFHPSRMQRWMNEAAEAVVGNAARADDAGVHPAPDGQERSRRGPRFGPNARPPGPGVGRGLRPGVRGAGPGGRGMLLGRRAAAAVPRFVRVLSSGQLLLSIGDRVEALEATEGADGSWTTTAVWRADLPGPPKVPVEVAGQAVFVVPGRPPARDRALVVCLDASTGAERGRTTVGHGADRLAADPANGRVFVGNAADGNVTVVEVAHGCTAGDLIQVSNSAEGVVVDPHDGTRYVLARLGGSQVHVWKKGESTVTSWAAGAWPFELAIDPERRKLFAATFFDTQVVRWDLDSGKPLPPVDLGVRHQAGDALGDFAYDPTTGIGVVVYPESGRVTAADLDRGTHLWTQTVMGLTVSPRGGPGHAWVAADGKRARAYVYLPDAGRLDVLDLRTGALQQQVKVAQRGRQPYSLNGMFLDRAGDRLWVGPVPVSLVDLRVGTPVADVQKVIYADGNRIIGFEQRAGSEYVVELDAQSLALNGRWSLGQSSVMGREGTYVPSERHLYVASISAATVTVYEL